MTATHGCGHAFPILLDVLNNVFKPRNVSYKIITTGIVARVFALGGTCWCRYNDGVIFDVKMGVVERFHFCFAF
jgi:hypothetical protein